MATNTKKSKLYWNIQAWILVTLISIGNANAEDLYPSKFESFIGDKFFLLTDTTFGPNEEARVRLEIRRNHRNRQKVEDYGGADIAIYKVKQPLQFLTEQKNLHRITTKYNYKPKGLILNALSYVWDSFYKKSRLTWQRILSFNARKSATKIKQSFRQKPAYTYRTEFSHYKQFREIKGFDLLTEFRYPLTEAKPIQPPGVKLAGSSHNFSRPNPGNIYVPLGKLQNGLYLVEAVIGDHRAHTLVFVSDSVLISKTSSKEMFLWTVSKDNGAPAPNTSILVSDGVGVLKQGKTDEKGVLKINLNTPELVYFIGQDEKGGIFISENYYYVSEIYAEKFYTFTDRPLYRPGDKVYVKMIGRKFIDSETSEWLKNEKFKAMVLDSAGTVILTENFKTNKESAGGDFSFRLPKYALSGGYTIIIRDKLKSYTSEFRVSKYTKPHYNIDIIFSKNKFKLNEKINGNLKLTYSNGQPVKGASIKLVIRRQKLNIIEGERDAESLFPVKVDELKFDSDDKGMASFELPATSVPSRYLLNVKSKDEASFSVRAARELLVELDTPTFIINSEKLFSNIGESVEFFLEEKLATGRKKIGLSWETVRLEGQSKNRGDISGLSFKVNFEKSGTYKLIVLNEDGNVVAGKNHIVKGDDLETLPGTVHIVLDKEEYDLDDKVKAFINFSSSVENALLTLERDKIENYSTSDSDQDWVSISKSSKQQWIAEIPVKKFFAPNITFSVLFVKDGKIIFNNKGIKVKMPKIKIVYDLLKFDYAVGEKVSLGIKTTYLGEPISSNVTLSIVDEMIYVLQPELAPDISDFFYHRRRNQVKTISSLDFHTYDASISATGRRTDYESEYSDRPLKMRERPRRENIDTAFWKTNIKTDSNGEAKVFFKIPDSVTRWRITSRAISTDGVVGQSTAHIKSLQSVYLKWGGLSDFRQGDNLSINVMTFNLEPSELKGTLKAKGHSLNESREVTLRPGINFTPISFEAKSTEDISLFVKGKDFSDKLVKKVHTIPADWMSVMSKDISLKSGVNSIELPSSSFNFRLVAFNNLYQRFLKAAEGLITYPHGCVEQTAGKLIPLSIAYGILKKAKNKRGDLQKIKETIINGRGRLVALANHGGFFGWYNEMPNNSYMTAYAYLADFYAGKVLGFSFTHRHWEKILEAYRKYESKNILRNAIVLWISAHVGQPVQGMVDGIMTDIEKDIQKSKGTSSERYNLIMSDSSSREHYLIASLMLEFTVRKLKMKGLNVSQATQAKIYKLAQVAVSELENSLNPSLRSAVLNYKSSKMNKQEIISESERILEEFSGSYSTADRSLALILMYEALGDIQFNSNKLVVKGDWRKIQSVYGLDTWQYTGNDFKKTMIKLIGSGDKEIEFRLYFDTYIKDKHELPVKITRNIYLLEKRENKYIASEVDMRSGLNITAKYIDEITIEPVDGKRFDRGMIEISLPPGGSVENNLGKLEVVKITESGADETIEIDNWAKPAFLSYKVPIKELTEKKIFRHAIQFTAQGKFKMPLTRFFMMYNPDKKAYRSNNEPSLWEISVN